jgi:hypothetical protein
MGATLSKGPGTALAVSASSAAAINVAIVADNVLRARFAFGST